MDADRLASPEGVRADHFVDGVQERPKSSINSKMPKTTDAQGRSWPETRKRSSWSGVRG